MATQERVYQPKDAVSVAIQSSLITGGAGLAMSAVQNSLARQNVGALGVFTRFGANVGLFGLFRVTNKHSELNKILGTMGGAYSFTKIASANLRREDDAWNTAIGGFVGGFIMGLRGRSLTTR